MRSLSFFDDYFCVIIWIIHHQPVWVCQWLHVHVVGIVDSCWLLKILERSVNGAPFLSIYLLTEFSIVNLLRSLNNCIEGFGTGHCCDGRAKSGLRFFRFSDHEVAWGIKVADCSLCILKEHRATLRYSEVWLSPTNMYAFNSFSNNYLLIIVKVVFNKILVLFF